MRNMMIVVMCALLSVFLTTISADAAKPKTSTKKTEKAADDMQCKEATIVGVISLQEGKEVGGKTHPAYYVITDSKDKVLKLPQSSKFKWKDYDGLKVKAVCMMVGSSLASVKTIDPVDKAAFDAKQAEAKAAAEKAAEAKKAAQQKK